MKCSVIVLTFNSEATIEKTIRAAQAVSDDIHVVDSYSADGTVDIVRNLGVKICQHEFLNYSAQRNWAIDNIPLRYEWQLHLDADEYLSQELIQELQELAGGTSENVVGYYIPRLVKFLGRTIRYGGMFPIWHLRLFRTGFGRCEGREYDQHFYVTGTTKKLAGHMVDDQRMSLAEWTARHNRWSDAEVRQLSSNCPEEAIQGKWSGTPVERKRSLRGVYYRTPPLWRAFGLFLYRYVIRLGFLDGKAGLIFYVLQTFWFRFLVDAKLYETATKRPVAPCDDAGRTLSNRSVATPSAKESHR